MARIEPRPDVRQAASWNWRQLTCHLQNRAECPSPSLIRITRSSDGVAVPNLRRRIVRDLASAKGNHEKQANVSSLSYSVVSDFGRARTLNRLRSPRSSHGHEFLRAR